MDIKRVAFIVILTPSALFGGCIPPSPQDVRRPCETHSDCLEGFRCKTGICEKGALEERCQLDGECLNGAVCENRLCNEPFQECKNDTDCEEERICEGGLCMNQFNFEKSYFDKHPEEKRLP
ncbi:MAG: hypothetical protein Kow0090_16190 [Myxococcota bacterium]